MEYSTITQLGVDIFVLDLLLIWFKALMITLMTSALFYTFLQIPLKNDSIAQS